MSQFIKAIKNQINQPGFKRYFANTSWLMLEQVVRILTGLFVGVWVARYLGPQKFGLFSYVIAFSAIFAPIARFGFEKVLIRDLVADEQGQLERMGTAFWLRVLGALVSLVTVLIVAKQTQQEAQPTIFIAIVTSAFLFQSFEIISSFFQSRVESKKIAISKLIQIVFSASLKLCFIWAGATLFWFVLIILLEQIVLVIVLLILYLRENDQFFLGYFNSKLAKQYLRTCWPLILSGLVIMVQLRIDHIMIKNMLGVQQLGYYSAASRLVEALGFIPGIIVNSLLPAIIHAKQISERLYLWRFYGLYRVMMLLFLFEALPLLFFGKSIILMLFGQAYLPSSNLFTLMIMMIFFHNYDVARNTYLTTENLVSYILVSASIGALINVVLNFYWIKHYGMYGAIWSTLVSFFITTFILDIFYIKARVNVALIYKSIVLKNFWKL